MKPYWALEFGQIGKMYSDKRLPKSFNDSTRLQYMEFVKHLEPMSSTMVNSEVFWDWF